MPKVSICLLTIDRFQMTKFCLNDLLSKSGIDRKDIELLVLDNGSTDKRVIDYGINVADIYCKEPKNIGVAKGFNKLFRLASGDYICTIGNDITVENNWLKDLIYYNEKIKNSGVSAIYCLLDKGIYNSKLGVYVPDSGLVYGIALWNGQLLNKIGGFDESLNGYGYEDSQFCFRAYVTGHLNYYIPYQNSTHIGSDIDSDTEYRKQKDNALKSNFPILQNTIKKMILTNNYKLKL
jgi:GT2 family glycosyltransferase